MSATMLARDAFAPQRPPGMRSGLALALLAHVLLVLALAWSVNWKTSEPDGVVAELWSALPQIAAPRAAPPEPPPPRVEPRPTPPVPRPEPQPAPREDAQIAIERAEAARKAEA
ncbi:MAG: cell envelope integrity protein TolA, partial [Caldimonas sp.]